MPPSGSMPDDAPSTSAPVSLGTSIVAVTFNGGVILGADTRTSSGSYVGNRVQDKITPLADHIYMLRSGSAAHTQAIASYVQLFVAQHQAEEGDRITVKTAANLVRTMVYNNKDTMEAGIIVAGWDRVAGGQVYGIALGGTMLQTPFATSGSGSAYIHGWCDKRWKDGMTEQEAMSFVTQALKFAMTWDASSGGCIRTVTVTERGAERQFIQGSDIPPTYGELGRDKVIA